MDQTDLMYLQLLFVLFSTNLQISFVGSELVFYGNAVTERSTSGMNSSIQPAGPRIWIDDPLNCDSCPRWGYLQLYRVFIHAFPSPPSLPLPRLYLQIWSNSTLINNYTLKWQKRLDNYQTGQLYEVSPDPGQVVEVNEMDRIGFTSDGNGNAVALDLEVDDLVTASTAHRTYFRLLYRDNNLLPAVGDSRYVDNNALRGRFSIGIQLDNAPPRKSTEVFLGHDLIRRPITLSYFMLDESVSLVSGRVTAFYFRLAQLTTVTSAQLFIWRKTSSKSLDYTLAYIRSLTLNPGPEQTYNVSISDGPLVDGSYRFGWNISNGLFATNLNSGNILRYPAPAGSTLTVGQNYAFDGLSFPYVASIGVIVDQQLTNALTSSKPSMGSVSSTSTLPPSSAFSMPTSNPTSVDKSSSSSFSFSSSSSSSFSSSRYSASFVSNSQNDFFSNDAFSKPPSVSLRSSSEFSGADSSDSCRRFYVSFSSGTPSIVDILLFTI